MRLLIAGLHPTTGDWIVLQELSNHDLDEKPSEDDIDMILEDYKKLIADGTSVGADRGSQISLYSPGFRLTFDPRKFLAVKVELV